MSNSGFTDSHGTRFAAVAFHGGAKFHQVFHVFEAFLKTADLNGQRFEGWFFQGLITHKLVLYSSLPGFWQGRAYKISG
jgi:hypothetical protein